ncbi:MAG: TolB family protein, partial [Candidatus Xenobia bacterium]
MHTRGWLLMALLFSAMACASPTTQSEIDGTALRNAATSGDIVLAERAGSGSRVEGIDAASGRVVVLRREPHAWLYWPTWASDGRAFAVTRIEQSRCDIEIINRDGKTLRRLPVDAWPWLAWRPHHDQLAVAGSLHDGQSGIHLLSFAGQHWRRLTDGIQEQWVAWSAAGDMLAFSRLRPQTIHVLSMATGQEHALCPGAIAVWAPQGHMLAVIGPARDRIDLVDADTGASRPLVCDI